MGETERHDIENWTLSEVKEWIASLAYRVDDEVMICGPYDGGFGGRGFSCSLKLNRLNQDGSGRGNLFPGRMMVLENHSAGGVIIIFDRHDFFDGNAFWCTARTLMSRLLVRKYEIRGITGGGD